MRHRPMLLSALSVLLSSSVTADVNPPADRDLAAVDIAQAYKLDSGDRVKITVFDEPSLSGEFTVNSSGAISFALIGEVKVLDRSTAEVEESIEAELMKGYLRKPQVTVEIIGYRPFFILGEVNAPGQYAYASGLTVMNAIATAQGFAPRAKKSRVFIRRAGEENEKQYDLTPTLKVFPGDTIRLGERYF